MAAKTRMYASQELIDVSYGAVTPAVPAQKRRQTTSQESTAIGVAAAASAVLTPQRRDTAAVTEVIPNSPVDITRGDEQDDLYSLSPGYKARSQEVKATKARPGAAEDTSQHSHATSKVQDSYITIGTQSAHSQAAIDGRPERTASIPQTVAPVLSDQSVQTPTRSATRVATTSAPRERTSQTTMPSTTKAPGSKLKMPANSALAALREKKARESNAGISNDPSASAPVARADDGPAVKQKPSATARQAVAKKGGTKQQDVRDDSTLSESARPAPTKLRGGMKGGTQDEEPAKPAKGKGKAAASAPAPAVSKTKPKSSRTVGDLKAVAKPGPSAKPEPKTKAGQTKRAQQPDDQDDDSDDEPVIRKRGRTQKTQESSQADPYEVPTSPPKGTGRETRAKAKAKQTKANSGAAPGATQKNSSVTAPEEPEEAPLKKPTTSEKAVPVASAVAADNGNEAFETWEHTAVRYDEEEPPTIDRPIKPDPGVSQQKTPLFSNTQADPVVISDNDDSSSELEPSPERPVQPKATPGEGNASKKVPLKPAATPANMRSSPPRAFTGNTEAEHRAYQEYLQQVEERLFPERTLQEREYQEVLQQTRDRKGTIIGWDKSGPRNQGALPDPTSIRTGRSSVPPGAIGHQHKKGASSVAASVRTKKGASSVATSARTLRSAVPKPSNVASNVGDVLLGLKTKHHHPQVSTDTVQPARQSSDDTAAEPAPQENLDHQPTAEYFNDETSLVEAVAAKQPTDSQVAMPPPQTKRSGQHSLSMPPMQPKVSDVPKATQTTKSRLQVPEPGPNRVAKATQSVQRSEEPDPVPTQTTAAAKKRTLETAASDQQDRKRAKVQESEPIPSQSIAAKKRTPDIIASNHPDRKRAKDEQSEPVPTQTIAAKKRTQDAATQDHQARKRAKIAEPPQGPTVVSPKRKPPASLTAPVSKPEPQARRLARKETRQRQASQGSQTVDDNGSPIPQNMDVAQKSTVLETYSQQAALMSEDNEDNMDDVDDYIEAGVAIDENYVAPPSHQAEPRSSNHKQRPTSPQAASKALSNVKLTAAQSKDLLEKQRPFPKLEDPFENSAETNAARRSPLGAFTKQIVKSALSSRAESDSSSEGAESPERRSQSETSSSDSPGDLVKGLDNQVRDLDECTAFARATEEDNETTFVEDEDEEMDTTLVDEVEVAQPTQRLKEAPVQKKSSRPSSGAKDQARSGIQNPIYEPMSDDTKAWCNSLKTHQASFHGGLIQVAQGVVEWFKEIEDSVSHHFARSAELNLRMIRDDERLRTQRYDQLKNELRRGRNDAQSTLKRRARSMVDGLDRVSEERKRQQAQANERERVNAKMEAWLDELS